MLFNLYYINYAMGVAMGISCIICISFIICKYNVIGILINFKFN